MTRTQLAVIAGAIVLAGVVVAFGPSAVADYRQSQRDDSLTCKSFQLSLAIARKDAANGKRPDWDALEQERLAGGCSVSP